MSGSIKFNINNQLLPMPMSLTRLAGLVVDINSSIDDFIAVIELDQALLAHVLKWSHSLLPNQIDGHITTREAINSLGTVNIIKLAMGQTFIASTGDMSSKQNDAENALWYHGIATAHAAHYLSEQLDAGLSPLLFTAGLIHDIGKLILGRHIGFEMLEAALKKEAISQNLSYLEAEQHLLGTDHLEMGSDLARNWHFPTILTECIESHHQRVPQTNDAVNIIILADAVGKSVHPGINSDQEDGAFLEEIISHLGLRSDCLASATTKVKEEMSQTIGL